MLLMRQPTVSALIVKHQSIPMIQIHCSTICQMFYIHFLSTLHKSCKMVLLLLCRHEVWYSESYIIGRISYLLHLVNKNLYFYIHCLQLLNFILYRYNIGKSVMDCRFILTPVHILLFLFCFHKYFLDF
jgi:hypothetical protein